MSMGAEVKARVPAGIKEIMDRHDDVNWSGVARLAIVERIKRDFPDEYRQYTMAPR